MNGGGEEEGRGTAGGGGAACRGTQGCRLRAHWCTRGTRPTGCPHCCATSQGCSQFHFLNKN